MLSIVGHVYMHAKHDILYLKIKNIPTGKKTTEKYIINKLLFIIKKMNQMKIVFTYERKFS